MSDPINYRKKSYYHDSWKIPSGKITWGGVIYIVENPLTWMIKIGISSVPQNRVMTLERGCGVKFRNIYLSEDFTNAKAVESKLHELFDGKRLEGEWFNAKFCDVVMYLERFAASRDKDLCASSSAWRQPAKVIQFPVGHA